MDIETIQEDQGLYYRPILRALGCPEVDGVIIPECPTKYLYKTHVQGIFDIILEMKSVPKGWKWGNNIPYDTSEHRQQAEQAARKKEEEFESFKYVYPVIDREEFKFSFMNAIADSMYDGCEPEDVDWDEIFAFLYLPKYEERCEN